MIRKISRVRICPVVAVMAASFLGNLMKGGGGDATALRKKKFAEGTLRWKLYTKAQETLRQGTSLKQAVKKPDDESFDDWLAVHIVDFYNRLQLLYGTVEEVCTPDSCPQMSGGAKYEYLWQDGMKFKVRKMLRSSVFWFRLTLFP